MITLTRVLLLRCSNVTRNKGILAVQCINNGSIQFLQNLNYCTTLEVKSSPPVKHNEKAVTHRAYNYSPSFLKLLHSVKEAQSDINKCIPVLHKMYQIFHSGSSNPKLYMDLNIFIMSRTFDIFCTNLDKNLPHFNANSLIGLLNLDYLGVSTKSTLMQKILTLILDNINSYSPYDKIFIYATVSRESFKNSQKSKDIKKALEFYFEEMFEEELKYCKNEYEMANLLSNEFVPFKVKKLMAEKIVSQILGGTRAKTYFARYLNAIFLQPVPLFSHSESIKLLKNLNKKKKLGILPKFVSCYKMMIERDDGYYDKNLCDILSEEANIMCNIRTVFVAQMFCLMGYLHDGLLKSVCESLSLASIQSLKDTERVALASCMARSCLHERNVLSDETWEGLKLEIQSFQSNKCNVRWSDLVLCEFLTFLGFDTRDLFNLIIDAIENEKIGNPGDQDLVTILRLHHIVKAYFPDEFTPLPDATLTNFVETLAASNDFIPPDLIDFIGGEDYLLNNCTTPDKHLLHYVAILGPDNKPINLSSFKPKTSVMPSMQHVCNIEDIERPSGSKVVVFQNFPDKQPIMFRNAPVMSGMARIFLKSFEALNFDIVLLPKKFYALPPEGKSEYLRSQLDKITQKQCKEAV